MNYTKEVAGFSTLETILKWVEEDKQKLSITDVLREQKDKENNYQAGYGEVLTNELNDMEWESIKEEEYNKLNK